MADQQGFYNAAVHETTGVASGNQTEAAVLFGNVRCIVDTFTLAVGSSGSIQNGDVIILGANRIPPGSHIIDATLNVMEVSDPAGGVLNIGVESNSAMFFSAADMDVKGIARTTRSIAITTDVGPGEFVTVTNGAAAINSVSFAVVVRYITA